MKEFQIDFKTDTIWYNYTIKAKTIEKAVEIIGKDFVTFEVVSIKEIIDLSILKKYHKCIGCNPYEISKKHNRWIFYNNYGYALVIKYCPFCGEKL